MTEEFKQISTTNGFMKHNGGILFRTISENEYEFKTNSKELMEIISGELSVQLEDETNWNNIKEGMSFNVSKDSSFKVKVLKTTNYSCSYLY